MFLFTFFAKNLKGDNNKDYPEKNLSSYYSCFVLSPSLRKQTVELFKKYFTEREF